MRGLIWVLGLFALAVGLSLAMNLNEGYVLLVVPPHRIEFSLNFALLMLIGGFWLCYRLVRTIVLARSLPRRARAYRERRALEKPLQDPKTPDLP